MYGDDLDLIDEKAREIAQVLHAVPGGTNAKSSRRPAGLAWPCGCARSA